jgi:hypothetical protein
MNALLAADIESNCVRYVSNFPVSQPSEQVRPGREAMAPAHCSEEISREMGNFPDPERCKLNFV